MASHWFQSKSLKTLGGEAWIRILEPISGILMKSMQMGWSRILVEVVVWLNSQLVRFYAKAAYIGLFLVFFDYLVIFDQFCILFGQDQKPVAKRAIFWTENSNLSSGKEY